MSDTRTDFDNSLCKDGTQFMGVLKNPTLTSEQITQLDAYIKISKELFKLTQKKSALENKKIPKDNAEYRAIIREINERRAEIEKSTPDAIFFSILEDYALKEFLSHIEDRTVIQMDYLREKIWKDYQEQGIIPADKIILSDSIEEQGDLLAIYRDSTASKKRKSNVERYFNQLDILKNVMSCMSSSDEKTPIYDLNLFKKYFHEHQSEIADVGESGFKITSIWSTKQDFVNKINKLLENFETQIYCPSSPEISVSNQHESSGNRSP